MSSINGSRLRLSIFGESHGPGIGCVLDGLPAGEAFDLEEIGVQMARRAPGRDATATRRTESDTPRLLSGFLEKDGCTRTTGAPLAMLIENENQRSGDYRELEVLPRPGHADYPAHVRYHGFQDVRGGGHFSGRLTAPLVFAGALCKQLLRRRGVAVGGHIAAIGGVEDRRFDPLAVSAEELESLSRVPFSLLDPAVEPFMRAAVETARMDADSVGGIVEAAAVGLPAGIGSPMFDGVENRLAALLFGIPAVKGLEFGDGFALAGMRGSEANDPYRYTQDGDVETTSNHNGGLLGGITNGMPLILRAAVKPTSSIGVPQHTVNLETGRNDTLTVRGRHDPCIVPRALPVVEAALALGLLDLLLEAEGNPTPHA